MIIPLLDCPPLFLLPSFLTSPEQSLPSSASSSQRNNLTLKFKKFFAEENYDLTKEQFSCFFLQVKNLPVLVVAAVVENGKEIAAICGGVGEEVVEVEEEEEEEEEAAVMKGSQRGDGARKKWRRTIPQKIAALRLPNME